MATVAFPQISETFTRSIDEVLRTYFGSGGTFTLGNKSIAIPIAELIYDVRKLNERTSATIAVIGNGINNQTEEKCTDPDDNRSYAYEVRGSVRRDIIVGIPKGRDSENRNILHVIQIWDILYAIFATQHKTFADKGIISPRIPIVPKELETSSGIPAKPDEFANVVGTLVCEVRARYIRDN